MTEEQKERKELTAKVIPVKVEIRRKYAKFLPDQINHGAWYEDNRRPKSSKFICSQCEKVCWYPQTGKEKMCGYKYCPWCGAFMDMKGDEVEG